MTKKTILICTLALVLVGGYYIGNFAINKAITNKVENIISNENFQKEIDKFIQSDNLGKDLAQLIPEDILNDNSTPENKDKPNFENNKNPKSSSESQKTTPAQPNQNEQKNNTEETKNKPEPKPNLNAPLQFSTKNEAIEFVRSRFTSKEVASLYKIYSEATKDGLTAEEKKVLKEKAYSEAFKKFTPQEIAAVKKVILGEN